MNETLNSESSVEYAPHIRRLGAMLIDVVIVVGVYVLLLSLSFPNSDLVALIFIFLYSVVMESSSLQGTLGKIAMRIKVVNAQGEKISFMRAILRLIGKYISLATTGITYILFFFDVNRQALEDKMAASYLVTSSSVGSLDGTTKEAKKKAIDDRKKALAEWEKKIDEDGFIKTFAESPWLKNMLSFFTNLSENVVIKKILSSLSFVMVLVSNMKFFLLVLGVIYLVMIYYKTVIGAEISSLIEISVAIFIIYQPLQTIVAQRGIPFSIDAIAEDEEVIDYFRTLFVFVLLVGLDATFCAIFGTKGTILDGIHILFLFSIYIAWYSITKKIFTLASGDDLSFLKMFGTYLFIIALIVFSEFSDIPLYSDLVTNILSIAIGLIFLAIKVAFIAFVLMPPWGIRVVSSLFKIGGNMDRVVNMDTLNSIAFIGLIGLIFGVPLFDYLFNSISSYTAALFITALMILISGIGAIYQISLIMSSFIKDSEKRFKYTIGAVAVFYLVMIVNMNVIDTIDNLSNKISHAQHSISEFDKSIRSQ